MENRDVKRVKRALERGGYVAAPHQNVLLILTDLRHYCDLLGLDMGELDRLAHDSYLAERPTARIYASASTRKRPIQQS